MLHACNGLGYRTKRVKFLITLNTDIDFYEINV